MPSDPGGNADPLILTVECPAWTDALPDLAHMVGETIRRTLARACPALAEPAGVSLLLTDDAAVRELNREWRDKDKPTNVLSFPATETMAGETPEAEFAGVPLELGDIALAFETCRREAAEQGKPLADHLRHLLIHGVLHLLGHDHEDEADAQVMEALEARILAEFGVADPYADDEAEAGHE